MVLLASAQEYLSPSMSASVSLFLNWLTSCSIGSSSHCTVLARERLKAPLLTRGNLIDTLHTVLKLSAIRNGLENFNEKSKEILGINRRRIKVIRERTDIQNIVWKEEFSKWK